jgi:hypothetical protein
VRKVLPAALCAALSIGAARAGTLVVNSSGDDVTPGDGLVTLREAIIAANGDATTDLGDIGSGADVIDLSGLRGSIALTTFLPPIFTDITIVGSGRADLWLVGSSGNGGADSGMFFVDVGGVLHLQDLTISGGVSQGGKGGTVQRDGAGGGAAGAGGAVFVNGGTFGATSVDFVANTARGGAGGVTNGPLGIFYAGGGGGFGQDVADMSAAPAYGVHATAGGNGGPFGSAGGSAGTVGSYGFAGNGESGGGGGGGGTGIATRGGNGGFLGGGGGAGWAHCGAGPAGLGGYGGGGGGGDVCNTDGYVRALGGSGGTFGGKGGDGTSVPTGTGGGGGGGAGLGGALFARTGSTVTLANCGFIGNNAYRGLGGSAGLNGASGANGQGKGGAIFLMSGVTATGEGVAFAYNVGDDSAATPADNADYFGSLTLTRGSRLGFDTPKIGVDAGLTAALHLQLPLFTSDGGPTTQAGSVAFTTDDGSAHAGSEFQAQSGTIDIPQGTLSGTMFSIDVPLLDPPGVHGPSTFTITLSNFQSVYPDMHPVETVTIIGNDTLFRNDFDGDGL